MAQPIPGSLPEGAGSPQGLTEGVSPDEWGNVKHSEFRRGDENRPQPGISASTRLNGESHPGSLSEGAVTPKGRD